MFNFILLASQGGENPYMSFIPLVLVVFVFYFFMIRPQMKKQKELQVYRDNLKKGDEVITEGGIYGKVAEIKKDVLILEVEDKMRLKVSKHKVAKDINSFANKK